MRIGIDIRSLSAGKHSGVEEYICNLLPNLFRQGSDDQFILLHNSWKFALPEEVLDWEKFPNVRIIKYRWPSKLLNASIWLFRRPCLDKLLGNDIDVMFLPNITFFSVSKSIPYVVTFHDLSFELFPHFFNLYRRIWHFLVNPPRKARESSRIITVSNSTAQDIKELYKTGDEKIAPIYLGISPTFLEKQSELRLPYDKFSAGKKIEADKFETQDQSAEESFPLNSFHETAKEWKVRKRYRLPENPFLLFLGTIEPRKNLTSLIKAYNEFRSKSNLAYDLVIAGSRGWSDEKIFRAAEVSPFRKSIYFPGPILNDDRPVLYSMSSLFIFPSFFEGFGLPPLESLASGVPVICSSSTSLLEVFGSHALTVNPHDIGEIAWAMERVLTDSALRESLISQGKKYAREFSWEKTAARTLEVLHEAAAS